MLLNRYLIREILVNLITVVLVLSVIFFSYSLTRLMTDAAGGLYKINEVLVLTSFKLLISLEVLLPLSLYLSIIFATARLANSNELTIFKSIGISDFGLKKIIMSLGIVIALITGCLSIYARPWAYQHIFFLKEKAQASSEVERIKARQFYNLNDGKQVVYIDKISGKENMLSGIFVRTSTKNNTQIISAPTGSLELLTSNNSHTLSLNNASVFKQSSGSSDLIGSFKSLALEIEAASEIDLEYKAKAASISQLRGSNSFHDKAELQWRLSTSLSSIILVLIALTLVDYQPRTSRFAKLPLAIAAYAIYYNVIGISKTWVEQGLFPTLWPSLIIFSLVVLFVIFLRRGRSFS